MKIQTYGGLWYGLPPDEVQPPKGFEFIASERDWLFARKDGKDYFVVIEDDKITGLERCRLADAADNARTCGGLKVGERFCDGRDKISFT